MRAAPEVSWPAGAVGIGWRQPHYRALLEQQPALDFIEVHSENFFGDGGAALHALERARAVYPVSLHGVGLSLGSTGALAAGHLDKLQRLVRRVEPALVSEHLCWGSFGDTHFNDLLPLPFTTESLAWMVDRVGQVQEVLGRPILVENVSAYLAYRDGDFTETAFLAELARRSGCGLLLDVNNLHVNAVNFGFDALARLAELPEGSVGEIHLAGHHAGPDGLIDTHDARVDDAVWALHAAALRRFGPVPALVEWDAKLPSLEVLLDEAGRARSMARSLASNGLPAPLHA